MSGPGFAARKRLKPVGRQRLWLGGLALSGVAAAHALAYLLVAPDSDHRTTLLASTGHGYWWVVEALGLGALVAGLAGFAVERLGFARNGTASARPWADVAPRLVVLQITGFLLLEFLERLIVEGTAAHVLTEPVVLIGVAVQAAAALLAAALIALFARVVDSFRRRIPFAGAPSSSQWFPLGDVLPPTFQRAAGGATLRGPPF